MKYVLPAALFTLIVAGCGKDDGDTARGRLNVSGRITDDATGLPIAGIPVHLLDHGVQYGGYGYTAGEKPLKVDTTDANGAYMISLEDQPSKGYSVYPVIGGQYVRSSPADGQNYSFTGTGDHVLDLRCFRAATVIVGLENTLPRDAERLEISGPFNAITLVNQVRDTSVALLVFGSTAFVNQIRFSATIPAPKFAKVIAEPADTIYLNFEF